VTEAELTFVSNVEIPFFERRTSGPLSWCADQTQDPHSGFPNADLVLVEGDGCEAMSIGRPRNGGERSTMSFENIQPRSGLEIVHYRRTFLSSDS